MTRVVTLSLFLIRDLFRSLQGIVPPLLTLVLVWVTMTNTMRLNEFATFAGFDLALICLVTTLLLASRAARSSTYPLLARLSHRYELLTALFLASLLITFAMALLLTGMAVVQYRVRFSPYQALAIIPRWLVLSLLASALGLNVAKLASRGGSYLIILGAIAVMGLLNEVRLFLPPDVDWLLAGIEVLVAPIRTVLTMPVGGFTSMSEALPLFQTITYSVALFALSVLIFHRKDLLWSD